MGIYDRFDRTEDHQYWVVEILASDIIRKINCI